MDLLDDMAWKACTIIYEDDEGLFRLQEVLKAHGPNDSPVTVRRLGSDPDYRYLYTAGSHLLKMTRNCCWLSTDRDLVSRPRAGRCSSRS